MATTINVTRAQLMQYHHELSSMKGGILEHFLASKTTAFYQNNSLRINTITDALNEKRKEYFVYVKNEKGEEHLVYEGEGEARKAVVQEGKDVEEYRAWYKEYMAQEIAIQI
jgi:hypothetical protein